jgi:hypothetical protein
MAHGGDKMFWVAPVEKASRQMIKAIEKRNEKFISQNAGGLLLN